MKTEKNKAAATPAQTGTGEEKKYKVTCGNFRKQNEALAAVEKTLRAGVRARLMIEKSRYLLVCAENMDEEAAAEMAEKINAKGVMAEILRQ